MTDIDLFTDANPFDAIRRATPEGREFWSARELMPLLGYERWENFTEAIRRAKISGQNAGHQMTSHIADATKMVQIGSGAGRALDDLHLSRLACYLIAMNGDPRKPEVAAAQTYFAVRTREAETSQPQAALSEDEIVHQALAITTRRVEALTARVAELEPKAEFYDHLMDADGCYTWNATAKILGWGRNVMLAELRKLGVVQANRLPYQRYAKHFKVVPGTYTHPNTGDLIPYATTYVLPSGIEFLRNKLAGVLV